jgi:hypothetical protein
MMSMTSAKHITSSLLALALLAPAACHRSANNSEVSSSSTVTINGHTSSFRSKITIKDGHGHVEFSLDGSPMVVRDFEQVRTIDVHPSASTEGDVELDLVRLDGSKDHIVFDHLSR